MADKTSTSAIGFGRDVAAAMDRRRQSLVVMGLATRLPDDRVRAPRDLFERLQRQELDRVGRELAQAKGIPFQRSRPGERVSGTLAGSVQLASRRFAMLEDSLGFQLVPWQPVLERNLGRNITCQMRGDGGIEWDFSRKLGLGL